MPNPNDAVTEPTGFVAPDEVPNHLMPQLHQAYDEKPEVQKVNETLTPATPTGYAPHVELAKSSGIDGDAGDWTAAGQDSSGFPVEKDCAEDVSR
jgi:hypothetical protein